jgi:hypothetical protein
MSVRDTFSKRRARIAKAGVADVYQYELPEKFRTQVAHIWSTAIGRYLIPHPLSHLGPSSANKIWQVLHDELARELGMIVLAGDEFDSPNKRCLKFLFTTNTAEALDIIQLSFQIIDNRVRKMDDYAKVSAEITQGAADAIEELNHRFLEHGIGYQYVNGEIMQLDSQFIHAEAVKPALALLNREGFEGPYEEFMAAFDHYKNARYKDAISEALKSFESTMKAIGAARKWTHPPNATARPLIELLLKNGLIPSELESHFTGLRSAMESGLPTLANSTSRHGQGAVAKTVPPHFANYALHLTASNIVFLVEAHNRLR